MIPRIDAGALLAGDPEAEEAVRIGAMESGFLTIHNTAITAQSVTELLAAYRRFFALSETDKAQVDMAATGTNRGWGGMRSEQVDPAANPDLKEVFDIGYEVPGSDLRVYAANLWPAQLPEFRAVLERYYRLACTFALELLSSVAGAIGEDRYFFADKFTRPMALLRGNFYPARPDWAGDRDFGIAAHTDYGCLTLLATDGAPGLEVQGRDGDWVPVQAPVGEFVINFGEMLEMWTGGRVKATPHRVVGTNAERLSVPLFFNPDADTNVAPIGSGQTIRAMDHLQKRFDETYVHLQKP